ncbi:MAG TPA: secretion system protein E, partial [Burkholderiales bacterium]|nr:secretion system protein E [Burkholderiales bacterium]
MPPDNRKKIRLGELLVQQGLISPDQLAIALAEQRQTESSMARVLVRLGFLTEHAIRDITARTIGQESIDLAQVVADPEALRLIPQEFARRHRILPIAYDARQSLLTIATTELFNVVVMDQLRA